MTAFVGVVRYLRTERTTEGISNDDKLAGRKVLYEQQAYTTICCNIQPSIRGTCRHNSENLYCAVVINILSKFLVSM